MSYSAWINGSAIQGEESMLVVLVDPGGDARAGWAGILGYYSLLGH